jgi:hypothetical protein
VRKRFYASMNDWVHASRHPDLPLALLAVFLMECLIALHTLWPDYPDLALVWLWVSALPLKGGVRRWTVALSLGLVLGEAIGYFIVVPWGLTWVCLPRNQYAVSFTMFLRLFCVLLAVRAWATARWTLAASPGPPPWRAWAADGGGVVLGLLLILPFAFISSHKILGHRPYYELVAESKARLQLGEDYADYQYFARRVDPVFRTSVSVTIRASLVAYNTALHDVQEIAVSWKEPWTGTR